MVGIAALCASVTGHMFRPLGWPKRLLLAVVALAAIGPDPMVSTATSLLVLAFAAWDAWAARRAPTAATASAGVG